MILEVEQTAFEAFYWTMGGLAILFIIGLILSWINNNNGNYK
jgi:hypothetical protein